MIDWSFNFWAVLISTIITFFIGMLWYSDILFGKIFRKSIGITDKQASEARKKGMGSMTKELILTVIASMIFFMVLSIILNNIGATTIPLAIVVSIVLWLGFIVTKLLNNVLWEKRPIAIYWLGIFHELVSIIIGAIIIALFL